MTITKDALKKDFGITDEQLKLINKKKDFFEKMLNKLFKRKKKNIFIAPASYMHKRKISSWTKSLGIARGFAIKNNLNTEENISIVLEAKLFPDNLFFDMEQLYSNYETFAGFRDEKELIALGPTIPWNVHIIPDEKVKRWHLPDTEKDLKDEADAFLDVGSW